MISSVGVLIGLSGVAPTVDGSGSYNLRSDGSVRSHAISKSFGELECEFRLTDRLESTPDDAELERSGRPGVGLATGKWRSGPDWMLRWSLAQRRENGGHRSPLREANNPVESLSLQQFPEERNRLVEEIVMHPVALSPSRPECAGEILVVRVEGCARIEAGQVGEAGRTGVDNQRLFMRASTVLQSSR